MQTITETAAPVNLGFDDLRQRWGTVGRPLSVRTTRAYSKQLPRMKMGRTFIYPLGGVLAFERGRTLVPVT